MAHTTLNLSLNDLPEHSRTILRRGWCLDEDPNHLWLAKGQWMDSKHDEIHDLHGPDMAELGDYEAMFTVFLDSLGLPDDMKASLVKLWAEDENNEIRWS